MTAPVSLHEQIPTNPPKTWTLKKKREIEERQTGRAPHAYLPAAYY